MDDFWDSGAAARAVGFAGESFSVRDAALDVDRARRGHPGDDRERAREMWQALLDGRWALVDCFEQGGRRFVVVSKRPAGGLGRGLSRRERQVVELVAAGHANKLISFELGISPGSVASALWSAMHKLGVRSRVELAQLAAVGLVLA